MTSDRPSPIFRTAEEVVLIGTMRIYDTQADASERIPRQWREFLLTDPSLTNAKLYGASPCTGDHKIHYLTGVAQEARQSSIAGEPLTLVAGEYAVVQVDDPSLLRDTWIWLLGTWLPDSGRHEKRAPEFERYTGISATGTPIGPTEIWIPLEPITG